jgi:CDP-6-deoxy-D-xylo-4-hexulose-3-dehydrase
VYSHFGFNLKATDMQAAVGVAQLDKLPFFIARRRHNFETLRQALENVQGAFILPEACVSSTPSWFGFPLTCRDHIDRKYVVQYLENKGIQTRMLFAGNLIKHPCFDMMREKQTGYRQIGTLRQTDRIMSDTFWVGIYPGMTDEEIAYMARTIKQSI